MKYRMIAFHKMSKMDGKSGQGRVPLDTGCPEFALHRIHTTFASGWTFLMLQQVSMYFICINLERCKAYEYDIMNIKHRSYIVLS